MPHLVQPAAAPPFAVPPSAVPPSAVPPSSSTGDHAVTVALAPRFATLAAVVAKPAEEGDEDFSALLQAVVGLLPAADATTLLEQRPGRSARTLAASGPLGADTDRLQIEHGQGPVLDAAASDRRVATDDLTRDPRWPELPSAGGARSALCVPVPMGDAGVVLTWYAADRGAFAGNAVSVVDTVAIVVETALAGLAQRRRARNLHKALMSNRRIGVAIGILMTRYQWPEQNAFARMSQLSQDLNRKLIDIADEVNLTGALPAPPVPGQPLSAERRPTHRAAARRS